MEKSGSEDSKLPTYKDVERQNDGAAMVEGLDAALASTYADATDSAYARKVYIINKVMNEHVSQTSP